MRNRTGSYKKLLFNPEQLQKIEASANISISSIVKLRESALINDIEFTTLYLILFLRLKDSKNYLQRHSKCTSPTNINRTLLDIIPNDFYLSEYEKAKLNNVDVTTLFSDFNLKGIPKSINRAILNWNLNKWNIVLSYKIPTSIELLKLQAENKRVLTLIVDPKRISTYILGARDSLSFAIHDLMHADQFFNNEISVKGQLGFYQFILNQYENVELSELLRSNLKFKEEFEYVVSDMNAYIIHLLKSFKACFSRADAEKVLLKLMISDKIPKEIIEAIFKLNTLELKIEDEEKIRSYFENKQEFFK